jgi:hypothetical protein
MVVCGRGGFGFAIDFEDVKRVVQVAEPQTFLRSARDAAPDSSIDERSRIPVSKAGVHF